MRIPGLLLMAVLPLAAGGAYYQRVIFDNSLTPEAYYHSHGDWTAPSTLEVRNGKLPVETGHYFTGPNALRLAWRSMTEGDWVAEIRVDHWRNRPVEFPGDTLFFWCYSEERSRRRIYRGS